MWTPLLLILSLAASSLGNSVPLVVYKRQNVGSTTIYQFKLNTAQSSPSDGYEMINGKNKEGGEFTYVKVYSYPKYEGPEGTTDFDSFDRKLSVCRMDYDTDRGRVSTRLLSGIGCNRRAIPRGVNINRQLRSISDTNQDFYVSRSRPTRVPGMRVTLTQCLQQSGQLLFTSLVEGNAACPPGSLGIYLESFWVVAHNGIACPDLKDYNGLVRSRDVLDGVFPSRATLECTVGYHVEGRSEVHCNSGRWSHDLGTCKRVSCGRPHNIDNGYIQGSDFTYESTIRYFCNEGHDLKPEYSQTRTCQHDGTWTPRDEPGCERKNCGFPETLTHGSLTLNGKNIGDVATYVCGDGYRLIGNQVRVCAENGTWTGSTPVCQPVAINCKAPAVTENVEIYYSFGEAINFKCKDGFHLQGSPNATCTANGWDNEPPSCSGN